MGIEWYILVGMGWFPVDIKGQGAGGIAQNGNVKHCNFAVCLYFFSPFDIWMDAVDVCEEWINVVVVDGCEGVVRFPEPEEDDVRC